MNYSTFRGAQHLFLLFDNWYETLERNKKRFNRSRKYLEIIIINIANLRTKSRLERILITVKKLIQNLAKLD